jgi:hypothetical protein
MDAKITVMSPPKAANVPNKKLSLNPVLFSIYNIMFNINMRTEHVQVDIPELKLKKTKTRTTPIGLPTIDNGGFIGGIIGSRGSSKTTRMIELLLMYDKTHTFDHVVIFSPSFEADPKYKYLVDHLEADVETFDDFTTEIFNELKQKIQGRLDEYKDYLEYKKVYEKFARFKGDIEKFPPDQLILLYQNNFQPPHTEYIHGPPTTVIVFDDLNYCKELYSNTSSGKNDVKRTMILHRHIKTSMLFLCQTYHNGVPKAIRNNLSLLILFKNKSPQMKKDISMELSSHIAPDTFVNMWDDATAEQYGFFKVDYDAKNPNRRFSKGWSDFYMVENDQ